MLIDLLHNLGLRSPMVNAISSTFQSNSCRLKIEGYLSERFPVNSGVREMGHLIPTFVLSALRGDLDKL
jgi:hypothetical protein